MSSYIKPGTETISRVILTFIVLINAVVPTAALALPTTDAETALAAAVEESNQLPSLQPVYYEPSAALPSPTRFNPKDDKEKSKTPEKDPIEFSISTEKGKVENSRNVTIHVVVRNNSLIDVTNLTYYDKLEKGLEFGSSKDKAVRHNLVSGMVTYTIKTLKAGEKSEFSYTVKIKNKKAGKLSIHNAEIEYDYLGETLAQNASLGYADSSSLVDSEALIVVPDQTGDGWETAGRYSLYLDKEVLSQEAVVSIVPTELPEQGPELQFNLELIQTSAPATSTAGELTEQDINLTKAVETAFESPAYLEINLDGVVDLTDMPADQEPYVATYDEESKVWVKVPIVETDSATNSVTVEAAHFSTWGAGLGNSLPKNGANVLLFDQPYTSLFTGASRYSIPIWTPSGRAGMAPDVSLSYSSATVDGVLGDVQAPWVGVGWNIDGIEVVRKITTNENGYGYSNSFALTLNGTVYELLVDPNNPNRFYTRQGSFLYVERHNFALGNSGGVTNKTGEWWEVVSTDGTRYRLGWNNDSEQLALMYGYGCKTGNPCTTPGGAYATLGYAGKADDLVALRWRVDKITDAHGNTITYTYTETQPNGATTLAPFDRESYLKTISYTGFEGGSGNLEPGYQVEFVTRTRLDYGDVPTTFNIWDNLDSQYLDMILIKCLKCETPNQVIRTYDLNYSLATVPNANGTLTLTDIKISGATFSEGGQTVPAVNAPTIKFSYQNLGNRNITGTTNDKYTYPRMKVINNGTGGLLTYSYETDGRGTDSWYNYRVKDVNVNSGMGTAALQSYTYTTPIYTNVGGTNLGDLIGYTTTSEKQLDYNNANAVILETKHDFGTTGLDTGYELKTEWLSGVTVLRKTTNTYVTDNTKAPFSGWNYRYLYQTSNFVNSGGSVVLASKVVYVRDPATGNLLVQTDFMGTSTYRKTYYEYLTNTSPSVYILDKASRVLVVTASNAVLSDTRYHYDDKINQAPTRGDLTLTQNLTGSGSSVVNSGAHYDVYGNVERQTQYTDYGTVNLAASGGSQESSVVYDTTFQTYPISQTNPMGQSASTAYVYGLGVPYRSTDINGWVTTTKYDSLGRQLSIQVPGVEDESVWYTYPSANGSGVIPAPYAVEMQILDTTANAYRSVWGIYDGMGRQIQMQVYDDDQDKILVTDTEFNPQGSVYKQSSPYYVDSAGGYYVTPPPAGTQFTSSLYDALGRVTQVTQPGPFTTLTSYNGFVTTVINPQGQTTERVTDGLGRMTTVREYSDSNTVYATTQYANDELNRLVSVTDAQSNITKLTYDWLGRKTGMDDPDMGIWTYQYNPTGTLAQQTDARTESLNFGYDALNRLISKTGSGVNTGYTYGSTAGNYGFRIGMTDGSGASTWSYSNFGRSVTEVRALNGESSSQSMTTTSDWLGRPLSMTYPDGEVLSYTYDALGRPDKLDSDSPADTLVDLTYNVLGQVEEQILGNGVVITNSYDAINNRLTSRSSTGGLINFKYFYDPAGNITKLEDVVLNETHEYSYDFLNRLKTAKAFTTSDANAVKYDQQFNYDKVGNITQMNDWVAATPIVSLDQPASSHGLFAPVSYRSPQMANAEGISNSLMRQSGDTETPTPIETQTATETATTTETETATVPPISTSTPTVTNTKVPTNTAAWTPTPTATPWSGADGYTVSMLHMDGTDTFTTFTDAAGKAWTVNGNAQIDTAQSKFGGASGLFQGTEDYLSSPDSTDWDFNGDFTIDFWVRFKNYNPYQNILSTTTDGNGAGGFWLEFGSARGFTLYNNTALLLEDNVTSLTGLTTGTWYHFAVIRSGTGTNNLKLYKDGVLAGQASSNATINGGTNPLLIGKYAANATSSALNGWVDELRVSKGIARWTSNFSVPTAAYGYGPEPTITPTYTPSQTLTPTKTNTSTITFTPSLTPTPYTITPTASKTPTPTNTLTPTPQMGSLKAYWNFEGVTGTTVNDEAVGDVTNNSAVLTNGPAIQPSGAQGSSLFFDGTNDYASIADQAEIKKDGSFTISAWVNPASIVTGRTQYILQKGAANQDYGFITISTQGTATPTAIPGTTSPARYANGSIAFQIGDLTPNTLYGPILPVNTWTMVTGVYDSTAKRMRLYLNGELVASQEVTGTVSMSTTGLTFSSSVAANVYHGSLDEVRFYNRTLLDSEVQTIFGGFATPTPIAVSDTPTVVTATPNITPIPLGQQQWGTGYDGDLTVAANQTYNINTQTKGNNGRTCADGIAYSLTQLGDTAAKLETTPAAGCLSPGDEVLLVQLAGVDTATSYNAGSFEFLRVATVNGKNVSFTTNKTKWYGSGWRSDLDIGTDVGQIRVMLMRVPNYNNVTINGTLKASAFDGSKYGVVMLRVLGTLSGSGTISASGLGYPGASGYGAGPNAPFIYHRISNGGGAGYGAVGYSSNSAGGGSPYGNAALDGLFMGSGGGAGNVGSAGGPGAGILFVVGNTINFSGTITAGGGTGAYGEDTTGAGYGGNGSGGSIRIEGGVISINEVTANGGTTIDPYAPLYGYYGQGAPGRIAVYYSVSQSVTNIDPSAYLGRLGQVATATPTPTPINLNYKPSSWGNGVDGDLVVSSGTTFNLSQPYTGTRSCADGGDGVAYEVSLLSSSSAKLNNTPSLNCLKPGDEILLLHMSGSGPNIGVYEFLQVGGVVNDTVYFTAGKSKWFGNGSGNDVGVGSSQKVMLQRVPNYNNVTINGTLKASAFDGSKYGVVMLRVLGTLSGSGTISVSGLGYPGASGYGAGPNAPFIYHRISNGGGAGYGIVGYSSNSAGGGGAYGNAALDGLFMGSGGGYGNVLSATGGRGAGILLIAGNTINFSGTITAGGDTGAYGEDTTGAGYGGNGSGGSIRIEGDVVSINEVTANGGTTINPYAPLYGYYGQGGLGRIAVYYHASFTGNFTPGYLKQVDPNATVTPTATVTVTPTPNPIMSNLVSWWSLNAASGTRNDSHGANHLTDNNTVTNATGISGNAGDFESTNSEFLEIADNSSLSTGDIDFTISAWVKLESKSAGTTDMSIVSKFDSAALSEYRLFYTGDTSDRFRFVMLDNATSSNICAVSANNFGAVTTATWYFIVAWHDAVANTCNIQVNNGNPNTAAETGVAADTAAKFKIGARNAGGQSFFDGLIDEVFFYKRVLTADERSWFYNSGSGRSYSSLASYTTPTTAPLPSGWLEKTYTYSTSIPHAVTSVADKNAASLGAYTYDANGNMTCRVEEGVTYKQEYNAENRISSIMKLRSGACSDVNLVLETKWDFAYDGDGTRMATLVTPYDETTNLPQTASLTSYYFGGAYETRSDGSKFKYYSFGGQSIVNEYDPIEDEWNLSYLLTDHLSSVVAVTDGTGALISQQRYLPFGGERTNIGQISQTDYGYTGQRDLEMGLMDYKARFYSPLLGRFTQPDSLAPGGPQGLNRYSYVINNPIILNDPTGHCYTDSGVWIPGPGDGDCDFSTSTPGSDSGDGGGSGDGDGDGGTGLENLIDSLSDFSCTSDGLLTASCLGDLAFGLDNIAFGIATIEMIVVDTIGAIVIAGMCEAGPMGCVMGLAIVGVLDVVVAEGHVLAQAENLLGTVSFLLTAGADILDGNTTFPTREDDGWHFMVGQDTLVSGGLGLVGQLPEANIDFVAGGLQLNYDNARRNGEISDVSIDVLNISSPYNLWGCSPDQPWGCE